MKKLIFGLCIAVLTVVAAAAVTSAATTPGATVIVPASAVKWTPMKGAPGAHVAVLFGDPSKTGSEFAMRYEVPDGFTFPIHYHPTTEEVTVLSGTLLYGVGDKVDASKMVSLPAGSYFAVPAGLHHYGKAKGVTIVEVHGIGPGTLIPVK